MCIQLTQQSNTFICSPLKFIKGKNVCLTIKQQTRKPHEAISIILLIHHIFFKLVYLLTKALDAINNNSGNTLFNGKSLCNSILTR